MSGPHPHASLASATNHQIVRAIDYLVSTGRMEDAASLLVQRHRISRWRAARIVAAWPTRRRGWLHPWSQRVAELLASSWLPTLGAMLFLSLVAAVRVYARVKYGG